jgi:Protein of unknown function (DUF664)
MTRIDPPEAGDERSTLLGFLEYHRATLLRKCDGLTGAQLAQRSMPPSELSLLGLVRHLSLVEQSWFQERLDRQAVAPLYMTEQDPDGDFHVPDGDPQAIADEAFATWRAQVARSNEIVAGVANLDQMFHHDRDDLDLSVRWLLVHMIEEYARHNGHADLLREAIDGATGE